MNKNLPKVFNPLMLIGKSIPAIGLPSTDRKIVNLSGLKNRFTVIYAYPKTSRPGVPALKDWDMIPGAKGCTPQSCAFRDQYQELTEFEAGVFGLSTQNTEYQTEAVNRLGLPFPLLSDEKLRLAHALGLPTFEVEGHVLLRRLTFIIENGKIKHVIYPVLKPEANAAEVIALLSS